MAKERHGVRLLVFSLILLLAIEPVNALCVGGCSSFAYGDNIRLHLSVTPSFMVFGEQVSVVVTSEEGIPKGTAIPCGPSTMWGTGCYSDKDYFYPTDSVKFKLTATGGVLKDTILTTDMGGKAVTTFTAGQQPGSFLISVEGISWGSKNSKSPCQGPNQPFHHPPKASTYVSIAPPVIGSGSWDVSEFAVVLYADPSLLHLNEVGQVITKVSYKGYPDKGRKVELQWDGGNLEASTGLTNSEGKFITNFSSPEKGIFTIIAKSQRLGENLVDTAILDLPVIPLPGGGSWGLSPPVANFSVNITEGAVPLTVQFQDTSGGGKELLHWRWDFGDRGISFEQNPVHTYTTLGTYSVSLMVENQAGRNATVKNDLITVHQQSFAVQIINFFTSIPAMFNSLLGGGSPSGSSVPVPTPTPTPISGENVPCDDGNPCTVDDYSRGGYCMSGRKLFCTDNNPQTIDQCDPDVGCVFRSRGVVPSTPTLPCDPGSFCGGACVDLASDPGNCGSCGTVCEPPLQCIQGICQGPVTTEGGRCEGGFVPCAGYCIDPATDPANCGGCGVRCEAGQVCMRGLCRSQCQEGYTFCSGICVDAASDPANCGGCGVRCTGEDTCEEGACRSPPSCESGLTSCAGGCVDTVTDPANCGGCGMRCDAGQVCMRGLCRSQCQEGFTFCSGSCVDLQSDRSHCGGCGNVCIRNQVCEGGWCIIPPECDRGFTYCSGQCIDTQADPLNCGGCGITCRRGEICMGGVCRQW